MWRDEADLINLRKTSKDAQGIVHGACGNLAPEYLGDLHLALEDDNGGIHQEILKDIPLIPKLPLNIVCPRRRPERGIPQVNTAPHSGFVGH